VPLDASFGAVRGARIPGEPALRQALWSLLENAGEASPRASPCAPRSRATSWWSTSSTTAPASRPNSSLARAGAALGKGAGHGLGLFLAASVARRLGGSLDAGNRPEGGASVRFALPLVGSERPHERARRLVIVEDDEDFARTLARSFERRGYEVRTATGPAELDLLLARAVRLCGGRPQARHHSGLPCVGAIAAADPATRIVVLTGFASIATAVEAIKLGAAHYLPKPSNTDDIEAAFGRAAGDSEVPVDGRATSSDAWNGKRSTKR
jgi:ActR/RegA family two-component response regulator